MGLIRDFINFIEDALWVTKLCFTSGWFWLIVGFGLYICIMPLLALAIHPATLLIVPATLIIYLIINEDKRFAAQYSLKKKEGITTPGAIKWNVKQSLEEYIQIINSRKKIQEENRQEQKE